MSKYTLPRVPALGALIGLLALNACELDKVKIPPLIGPSELGVSLYMEARPDILPADGVSLATIAVTVRDPDGRPLPNRAIFFLLLGSGALIGTGIPIGDGLQMVSDSNGAISLLYQAGTRRGFVTVTARPYGVDANANVYRSIAIELR